ncbi:bifunctional fructose-bisphosphatase/inositol-phosphate phosphatase [Pyrococcus sp. ST04]|uniref:bifunctional fructose-bisphosphatase/inositol-phosphate phosphatase n=1 Tax=Pyrococcus sp. ST04 TaxID=1183377 RepID=UPI00026058B2|nr:bifunctional fructose-bisphosphatase/inositol-phosphate phosphatase [Pyrococcus sp. ST04]AFK21639.1 bifunctional inositol-1 monophosphatase/fructose-1,6-bisphosphatase [Pyrococcus sp. ST04]
MSVKWWRRVALDIVHEVESNVMPLFGDPRASKTIAISPSGDETKLIDKIAEDSILAKLRKLGINIVSEEIGSINQGSKYTALVDPLDGSYNFISGIPFFAISVAIFEENQPIYAFIYEPITDRLFEGIPGKGAYLNGEKIRVREPIEKPAISFYTRGEGIEILNHVKRTRTLGAIALELAYLAMGALDGVVDIRRYVRPTDIAAGVIIAREAGALVKDSNGNDIVVSFSATEKLDIIAVNSQELLQTILSSIKR